MEIFTRNMNFVNVNNQEMEWVKFNGTTVWENFKKLIAEGVPPLQFTKSAGKPLIDYKLYGNSYKELDYIQSTGTQYINTNIKASNSLKITGKFQITNLENTSNYVLGCYANGNASRIQFSYATTPFYGWGASYDNTSSLTIDTNIHTFELSSSAFKLDDTTVYTPTSTAFTNANTDLYIFGRNGAGTSGLIPDGLRIYGIQIYENGVLVRDYIPAKDQDDKAGMFDKVNSLFYKNNGTGNFTAGTTTGVLSVGDKTLNLLDIYGRTAGTQSGSARTTPRTFDYTKYYSGFANNNYYNTARISNLSVSSSGVTFTSNDVNYGIGFPVEVEPSTKYYISGETIEKKTGSNQYNIGVGYYDVDGNPLTATAGGLTALNFTTPATAKTALIVLLPKEANTSITHKNIMLSLTNSSYEPYGKYGVPIKLRGKNLWQDETLYKYQTNGGIIPSGTSAAIRVDVTYLNEYIRKGDVTLSATITLGPNDTATDRRLGAELRDTNNTRIKTILSRYSTSGRYSVTVPQTTNIGSVIFRFGDYGTQNTIDITVTDIMVEVGSLMTTFEPRYNDNINKIYLDEPLRQIGEGIPAILPSGYTNVGYLETNGNQYIDANITCNQNSKIECVFSANSVTAIMGYQADGVGITFNFGGTNNSRWGNDTMLGYTNNLDGNIHRMTYSKDGLYDNEVPVYIPTQNEFTTGNIYLFRANGAATTTANRIYRAKIWNGSKLVRDLVPAKNSSNVLGMYDLVNDIFYINAGTGTFTAGNQIYSDYIDYGNQKVIRNVEENDGVLSPLQTPTEQDIVLDNMISNVGTNIIEVQTSVTPSNVWLKYKGKE